MTDTKKIDEIAISIHVPRVEDDFEDGTLNTRLADFNPRPPCGGRHDHPATCRRAGEFQSTSPVWRTTTKLFRIIDKCPISIHVPRVEDDLGKCLK